MNAGTADSTLRVLIVAEHASLKFGGEAALPLHYYRILRRRAVPVWLVVHERTRSELQTLFPGDGERIAYIHDSWLHRLLWRLGAPCRGSSTASRSAFCCAY